VDGNAAAQQAAHLVPLAQELEGEGEDSLDLGRVRLQPQLARVRDDADEGMDAVAGDEGRDRRQRPLQHDGRRVEGDLLLRLAQRRRRQVGVAGVLAPAGEGDLAGVTAQVGAALGEDQPRFLGPAVDGEQHRGVRPAARLHRRRVLGRQQQLCQLAQMITWTVPPSTDQAAPLT
jgi:hypothetical protein